MSDALREYVLAFADDELVMGHRHSEWLGVAPFLEEDLAYASIAQDELGHARALYGVLGDDLDALAFRRPPGEYRSCRLVELPCVEWEMALARHFLYDLAERVRWETLAASSHPALGGIAAKAAREEEYHLRHVTAMVRRMLTGTDESRRRVLGALESLAPVATGLFEPTPGAATLVADGVVSRGPAEEEAVWRRHVADELAAAVAAVDFDGPGDPGAGRRGERSEHFAELFAKMTSVLALDPEAAW